MDGLYLDYGLEKDYIGNTTKTDLGEIDMELNYFKDILFDLLNEWDQDILEILTNDGEDLFWVIMGDGSVFRLHCKKEVFHLFQPPNRS